MGCITSKKRDIEYEKSKSTSRSLSDDLKELIHRYETLQKENYNNTLPEILNLE